MAERAADEAPLRAYVCVGLMVLIGSSTAPAAKLAVRELPAGLLPLIRFGLAGLCLLPLVVRQGGWDGLARMAREDGWRLLVAASLCVPVNQAFFLNGAKLAPTSHAALIYASLPLVVLVLASALGQEMFAAGRLVGVILSTVGVFVIGLDSLWLSAGGGHATLRGDLLLVGAVSSWGAYLTASKPLIARHGPLTALAATFLVGTILHVPIALFTLPGWTPLSAASPMAWGGLIYLTLIVTVIGLAFQNLAMMWLDASQVATFNNAAPVLTVAWGAWLFGETATPALVLGGVLTLGGVVWTSRASRPAQSERLKLALRMTPQAARSVRG